MTHISLLVISTTLSLMLIGCSSKNTIPDNPPAELYATAKKKLQSGHFKDAIKQLEALDSRYPFGPYSQQVQLDLIYAYYKSMDLVLAQASIDRFMRLNSTHPDIDYVLYMKGLINMSLDDNLLHSFFGIDRSDRDPQYARNAFRDFRELVQNHPGSQYVADSNKRLIFLKNKLANYELAIAEYYTRREAYVAVVNRIEQMIKNYPDTQATRHGLPLMKKAYEELGLTTQADKTDKLIAANQT